MYTGRLLDAIAHCQLYYLA
uniref:Uncharacterized protein n=1 Tax=Anguilla anguilla TaxID=7936 RepID=A0A0E9ULV3_ANGAN